MTEYSKPTPFTTIVQVTEISPPVEVGTKGYMKQTLVGETDDPKYPDVYEFEAFGRDREHIEKVKVGDVIEITAMPRGRRWTSPKTGKESIFLKLSVQNVRVINSTSSNGAEANVESASASPYVGISVQGEEEDMPF